jgi:hypothetical protein
MSDFKINIMNQHKTEGILPTYMKNLYTLMQIKEKVDGISWDNEGVNVKLEYFNLQLLSKNSLTQEDKKLAKLLILKGVPNEYRCEFWMLCSGARREKQNNPGYYDFVKSEYPKDIDLPHYHQIELVSCSNINTVGY